MSTIQPECNVPIQRSQIVSAAAWTSALVALNRATTTIQAIFIARLFEREDVGLLSVVVLVGSAIQAFTETGHEAALIQLPQSGLERTINTAWVGAIVRGVLLCAALVLAAGPIAEFYSEPRLRDFIAASSLYFAISGFKNLHIVRETRDINLRRPKLLSAVARIGGFSATLLFALVYDSLWCVIIGGVFERLIEVIGSHIISRDRARLVFNLDDFRRLFRFGRSIQLTAALVFLITQIDNAVVGKVVSLSALAVYACAYTLANLPMTQVVGIASQVAFPVWAKVAREGTAFERNAMFLSTSRLTVALSIALSAALWTGGGDLAATVYGPSWADVEIPLRILLFFGLFRGIASNFGALFNSMGRPDLIAREITLKFVAIAVLIYPMTVTWGVNGAALAVTLPMCIITPSAMWIYLGIAGIERRVALQAMTIPITTSAVVLALWWLAEPWLGTVPVWVRGLGVPLMVFALICCSCWILDSRLRAVLRTPANT